MSAQVGQTKRRLTRLSIDVEDSVVPSFALETVEKVFTNVATVHDDSGLAAGGNVQLGDV